MLRRISCWLTSLAYVHIVDSFNAADLDVDTSAPTSSPVARPRLIDLTRAAKYGLVTCATCEPATSSLDPSATYALATV